MSSSSAAPAAAPAAAASAAPTTKTFAGRVYISPDNPEQNIPWAQEEYSRADRATRLVFWTDGSMRQTNAHSNQQEGGPEGTHASSAVVWRQDFGGNDWEWDDEVIVHGGTTTIRRAELHALFMALRKAEMILKSPAGAGKTSVGIYTDNLRCANCILVYYRGAPSKGVWNGWGRDLFRKIMALTKSIRKLGVQVDLTWIPGHAGVEGNTLVDYIAKRASGTLWDAPSEQEFVRMMNRALAANATERELDQFVQLLQISRARGVFSYRDEAREERQRGNNPMTT